ERQVDLAVRPERVPRRADQDAGVIEAVAVALEQAEDGGDLQAGAGPPDLAHARAGDGLGVRGPLGLRLEPVSGQGALGEDDEAGASLRGLLELLEDPRAVVRHRAEGDVHLHGGDAEEAGGIHQRMASTRGSGSSGRIGLRILRYW